jgi:hypothetical protein
MLGAATAGVGGPCPSNREEQHVGIIGLIVVIILVILLLRLL